MSDDIPSFIPIFEAAPTAPTGTAGPGSRPFQARGLKEKAAQMVETSISVLSENMASFIAGISHILAAGAEATGSYEIDSVEVECLITGTGKIGLVGTGLDLQGGSTLKIIFTRKKESGND